MNKNLDEFQQWLFKEIQLEGFVSAQEKAWAYAGWQASKKNEWIPIEQAPKDTPILLLPEKEYGIIPVVGLSSSKWYNGGEFYLVDERGEAVYFDDGSYLTIFPTHFKYL
jgi:hypothetical protein